MSTGETTNCQWERQQIVNGIDNKLSMGETTNCQWERQQIVNGRDNKASCTYVPKCLGRVAQHNMLCNFSKTVCTYIRMYKASWKNCKMYVRMYMHTYIHTLAQS